MPGHWVLGLGFALVLAASQSNCGFPDYEFGQAGASGIAGSRGGSGSAGTSGAGGAGGSGASVASGGTGAVAGESGAGAAGSAPCLYPTPVTYPSTCFDGKLSGSETGIDCGGGVCAPCSGTQACVNDADCASGTCTLANTCAQTLSLQYTSIVTDAFTRTPKFRLLITYLGTDSPELKDLRIRYYFNHNDVTEPVIALDTQATFDPGDAQMDISSQVSWAIHRFPLGPADTATPSHTTDSYLEISFSSSVMVEAGTKIDMTQDIVAGSADIEFQQGSHYSFMNTAALSANNAITVYVADVKRWGVEPPLSLLPDCAYVAGVNLGGPAIEAGDEDLSASSEANVVFTGSVFSNPTSKPLPTTDVGTTELLTTAFTLGTSTATWPVPNGKFWAYAWVTSAESVASGTLAISGAPTDKFYGLQKAGSAWALIGPYSIDVTSGSLALTGTGSVNLAGLELYQRQP